MSKLKKLSFIDMACFSAAILCVIIILIIPTTGPMVLVEELCNAILMLTVGLWLLRIMVIIWKTGNRKNNIYIAAVTLVFLCISMMNANNTVLDYVEGPQIITLMNCETERRNSVIGIISLDYYLIGTDDDSRKYRLKISGSDYERLSNIDETTIECYVNTKRILSY